MLTNEQLLNLFISQDIPLIGRKVVEKIRGSEPFRRVGGGTHNVVTRFASKKMGCVIQAESHKGESRTRLFGQNFHGDKWSPAGVALSTVAVAEGPFRP